MKPIVVFYICVGDKPHAKATQMLSEVYHMISDEFRNEYWTFVLPVRYQESRVELLHAKGSEQLDIEKLNEEVNNMIKNYKNG
jgi:hypothetical protein